MLTVADRQQGLFDAGWCWELLPEDSIYALLAEHGDRIVRDEDFSDCYSGRQGRPSIRRACWRRCCCWLTGMGCLMSGRWTRCGSICAGRSR